MASDYEYDNFDLNAAWNPMYDEDDDEILVQISDGSDLIEGDITESDQDEQEQQQPHQLINLNLPPNESDNETSHQEFHHHQNGVSGSSHHKPKLSTDQRGHVLTFLLNNLNQGKLNIGAIKRAASKFNVHRKTISRLWKRACQHKAATQTYFSGHFMHQCGRKRVQVNASEMGSINMGQRTCIRDLASMLNCSKSTAHRVIKRGQIKPHTNALKPSLKKPNKLARIRWIYSLLQGTTVEQKTKYMPMFDFVQLDEKWFYVTRKSQRYYIAQGERGRHRTAKSSTNISKVMFTAIVAKLRFNSQNQCTFDGKLGVFPFTYQVAAKRNSKNRSKGTMVTKLVESVTKEATREMLIKKVVPAIKQKWPAHEGHKVIYIQQDNARTHITQDDPQWQQVHRQDDFTFILIQQPANSPDLNILDLGFFRSVQSLMHKKMPKNVDEMIEAVHESYNELEPKTLHKVWLSLQHVINEILKDKGNNKYALPHVNKQKLEKEGRLYDEVTAPQWAVRRAWDIIQDEDMLGDTSSDEEEFQIPDLNADITNIASTSSTAHQTDN